ncbi:hypothetical protein D3C78_962640 [compost metagenome]
MLGGSNNALETGLGIEEELARRNHLPAFFQTFQNLRLAIAFLPGLHLHRAVAAGVFGEHYQGTSASADNRLTRHPQHTVPGRVAEADLRGQTWSQASFGIG